MIINYLGCSRFPTLLILPLAQLAYLVWQFRHTNSALVLAQLQQQQHNNTQSVCVCANRAHTNIPIFLPTLVHPPIAAHSVFTKQRASPFTLTFHLSLPLFRLPPLRDPTIGRSRVDRVSTRSHRASSSSRVRARRIASCRRARCRHHIASAATISSETIRQL